MQHVPRYVFAVLVFIGDLFYLRWAITIYGQLEGDPLMLFWLASVVVAVLSLQTFYVAWSTVAVRRKGQLAIQFRDQPYEYGQALTGIVHLHTHTTLDVRSLRIALAATRERRSSKDGSSYTDTDVIWRREEDLHDTGSLAMGTHTFDFAFTIPRTPTPPGDDSLAQPVTRVSGSPASPPTPTPVEDMLKRWITPAPPPLTWTLTATLDVPGLDLDAEQLVFVNDRQWT